MTKIAFLVAPLVFAGFAWADTPAPPQPTPAAKLGCPAPENRQFDFMAGSWVVGQTGKIATPSQSKWTVQAQGCSIQENWFPSGKEGGNSINYYDLADKKWHQHWIGADGDAVHYIGAWTGTKMEFRAEDVSTPQMQNVILTMTFEPMPDGSVRQSGTQSVDGGKTFQPSFDLTYRKSRP